MSAERLRLYLSGPMTGVAEFNRPAFAECAAFYRSAGFTVFNPGEVPVCDGWVQYMRLDLRALLDCHAVALLPGWERSRGATVEANLAHRLGLPKYPDSTVVRDLAESGRLAGIIRRRLKRIGWAEMPDLPQTQTGVFVELTESETKSGAAAKQKEAK